MTKTMFVIIKGNETQAMNSAAMHRVSVVSYEMSKKGNECYAYVDYADRAKVIDWYSKEAGTTMETEIGGLLWYSDAKDFN